MATIVYYLQNNLILVNYMYSVPFCYFPKVGNLLRGIVNCSDAAQYVAYVV